MARGPFEHPDDMFDYTAKPFPGRPLYTYKSWDVGSGGGSGNGTANPTGNGTGNEAGKGAFGAAENGSAGLEGFNPFDGAPATSGGLGGGIVKSFALDQIFNPDAWQSEKDANTRREAEAATARTTSAPGASKLGGSPAQAASISRSQTTPTPAEAQDDDNADDAQDARQRGEAEIDAALEAAQREAAMVNAMEQGNAISRSLAEAQTDLAAAEKEAAARQGLVDDYGNLDAKVGAILSGESQAPVGRNFGYSLGNYLDDTDGKAAPGRGNSTAPTEGQTTSSHTKDDVSNNYGYGNPNQAGSQLGSGLFGGYVNAMEGGNYGYGNTQETAPTLGELGLSANNNNYGGFATSSGSNPSGTGAVAATEGPFGGATMGGFLGGATDGRGGIFGGMAEGPANPGAMGVTASRGGGWAADGDPNAPDLDPAPDFDSTVGMGVLGVGNSREYGAPAPGTEFGRGALDRSASATPAGRETGLSILDQAITEPDPSGPSYGTEAESGTEGPAYGHGDLAPTEYGTEPGSYEGSTPSGPGGGAFGYDGSGYGYGGNLGVGGAFGMGVDLSNNGDVY